MSPTSPVRSEHPLSWLTLERYQLRELEAAESVAVEAHLRACPSCQQCLELLEKDPQPRLKPLPALRPAGDRLRFDWTLTRWAAVGLATLTCFALLWVVQQRAAPPGQIPGKRVQTKGGELAVSLVRERKGDIQNEPATFEPADRFQVLATCPAGLALHWDVVVFQDGEGSFPYPPARSALACANRVALPGAFRLTGTSAALVCLVTAPTAIDRGVLARIQPQDLPEGSACYPLPPAAAARP